MAVLSAIRLRDTQTFGKQDPYVVLKCGGHGDTFRTKVCRDGGTAPKWNERFTFALAGTEGNELNLRIWNRNTMTSDKCIGSATVKLDAVFKNETDDVDVEVFDTKGRAAGVINLVLTFTPSGSYVVQQQQQQPDRLSALQSRFEASHPKVAAAALQVEHLVGSSSKVILPGQGLAASLDGW